MRLYLALTYNNVQIYLQNLVGNVLSPTNWISHGKRICPNPGVVQIYATTELLQK